MTHNKMSIKEIKKIIFEEEFRRFPYLDNFKRNPYTYCKARYYMYFSVLVVYVLIRSRITPNMVTIAYGLCGIIGGILLSIPNLYYNIIGVLVFFNKGILDWSDGHLARIKYEPTLTGHILDIYGATINSIGLRIGLGFFVINQTSYDFLIYFVAVIPFLHTELYSSASKKIIIENLNSILSQNKNMKPNKEKIFEKENLNTTRIKHPEWLNFFKGIFDDNAKNVDLILLFIVIDIYTIYNFSFYIFLLISIKILIRFILSFIYGVRTRWAEMFINNLKIDNESKKND